MLIPMLIAFIAIFAVVLVWATRPAPKRTCPVCRMDHPRDASYCRRCGESLTVRVRLETSDACRRVYNVYGVSTLPQAVRVRGIPKLGTEFRPGSALRAHRIDVFPVGPDVARVDVQYAA